MKAESEGQRQSLRVEATGRRLGEGGGMLREGGHKATIKHIRRYMLEKINGGLSRLWKRIECVCPCHVVFIICHIFYVQCLYPVTQPYISTHEATKHLIPGDCLDFMVTTHSSG